MAEFVQKKIEDMRPVLEKMKILKMLSDGEIRKLTKKWKEHEYKLQRHKKCKEDYLRYIQYQMDLLKLIKLRRKKFGITKNKSDLDFTIANKINHLYKEAIYRFQDDLRFWIAYITFCKHFKFNSCASRMISRMLLVHSDKPKCWHIAARWELEENKNFENARDFLLKGLHVHNNSQLLYTTIFKLELDYVQSKTKNAESKTENTNAESNNDLDMQSILRKAYLIYEQAFQKVKDVKFIVELLNILQEYKNTEKLQHKIVNDIIVEYPHEPLMWDTMAQRELKGLIQPTCNNENSMVVDGSEPVSVRDKISNCYEVYQIAVKKIKTEEMWSLFIDCMLEINQDVDTLPNFKRKLLRNALLQAHQAKKLKEKYYLAWIDMLNVNEINQDTKKNNKLCEVLCWANEAFPESESLWQAKLQYLLHSDQEELGEETFKKAIEILGENSISLWKLKLLHIQTKNPKLLEKFYQEALDNKSAISNYFKPLYIEWIALTKDIEVARKVYDKLCLTPPLCLELHRKMAVLEILQPEITLYNARKPHEMATSLFGRDNTDVWIKYIIFEMKHGEATKVSNIYDRAKKMLKPKLTDDFINEYSMIKAHPKLVERPL
ncbi:U3 small nucleolar RNA-associated protein 6 homolog isoform X2 [Phymastichus coffea]|uniref:U3 small nucleolar RNA-associated protein 6 homolog isoform X2 n=1 Tax=Phymastichus coffea TaxID=108790 RepID=UPI00273B4B9A|nr:U3 small nucleolar RNA-associated protein 6 homolog isoform X2 [Phymastichus coffea]